MIEETFQHFGNYRYDVNAHKMNGVNESLNYSRKVEKKNLSPEKSIAKLVIILRKAVFLLSQNHQIAPNEGSNL